MGSLARVSRRDMQTGERGIKFREKGRKSGFGCPYACLHIADVQI